MLTAITHDLASGPMPNGVWIGGMKYDLMIRFRSEEETVYFGTIWAGTNYFFLARFYSV